MRLLFALAASVIVAQLPLGELPLVPPTLRTRWMDDMRSKNLTDVLSLYASGATFISPDGTAVSTSGDLRKLYETQFAAYDADITLAAPTKYEETGEPRHTTSMIEKGTYRETLRTRATNATQTLCGGYTFSYVRATGGATGWRISRMEWTTTPCPTQ